MDRRLIIKDALSYYYETILEDPIPRTEDKGYTPEEVRDLLSEYETPTKLMPTEGMTRWSGKSWQIWTMGNWKDIDG